MNASPAGRSFGVNGCVMSLIKSLSARVGVRVIFLGPGTSPSPGGSRVAFPASSPSRWSGGSRTRLPTLTVLRCTRHVRWLRVVFGDRPAVDSSSGLRSERRIGRSAAATAWGTGPAIPSRSGLAAHSAGHVLARTSIVQRTPSRSTRSAGRSRRRGRRFARP